MVGEQVEVNQVDLVSDVSPTRAAAALEMCLPQDTMVTKMALKSLRLFPHLRPPRLHRRMAQIWILLFQYEQIRGGVRHCVLCLMKIGLGVLILGVAASERDLVFEVKDQ
jgi:hypothetical protein